MHEPIPRIEKTKDRRPREKQVDILISRLDPERAAEMGVVTGREALEWLSSGERTGKYVFHGTPFKIEGPLEPRQAHSEGQPDGTPAVAATAHIDIPIFMAIISSTRDRVAGRQHRSSWGGEGKDITFKSWPDQLDRARKEHQTGYVYVFDANDFSRYQGVEVRSESAVEPIYCIPVAVDDLPEGIEEIEQGK